MFLQSLKKMALWLFLLQLVVSSCSRNNTNNTTIKVVPFKVIGLDTLKNNSGLMYLLVNENPTGALPEKGKQVKVHYTGYFTNGKIFDSSVKRGEPLTFTLGVGQVIKGWDEGIELLHVGEKARFIIPYELGYGIEGSGQIIPPMSTLIFDVELLEAEK
jgi:peptidylprolyl isomerase